MSVATCLQTTSLATVDAGLLARLVRSSKFCTDDYLHRLFDLWRQHVDIRSDCDAVHPHSAAVVQYVFRHTELQIAIHDISMNKNQTLPLPSKAIDVISHVSKIGLVVPLTGDCDPSVWCLRGMAWLSMGIIQLGHRQTSSDWVSPLKIARYNRIIDIFCSFYDYEGHRQPATKNLWSYIRCISICTYEHKIYHHED